MPAIPEHLDRILTLARWAPSGDNTQPWRFEVVDDMHVRVHGYDTRDHVVYDLDGHASQLAVGALLETLEIAASTVGLDADIAPSLGSLDTHLVFDVRFNPNRNGQSHPLAPFIEKRAVQRRPMSARPMSSVARHALEDSVGQGFTVLWFESFSEKARLAKFMFDNAKIRLSIPEAYPVHKAVIEWNAQFSYDRIPDQAVGADPLTLKLMHWAMESWDRVSFLNRFLLGDLAPRLQLDLFPGLFCAAHFAIIADAPPTEISDYLEAGRAVQRFWLTATQQDLWLQPEMTPVIFTRYARQGVKFTQLANARALAERLNGRLGELLRGRNEHLVFMGRIGFGATPRSRSLRKPLDALRHT
jgi:hypothetical protein